MDITCYLTECVLNNIPVSFSKYGDGEYYCAMGAIPHNCDYDTCTIKLKTEIINSLKYLVNETENSYIGLWHDNNNMKFWEDLTNKNIKWAAYHSILIDNNDMKKLDSKLENKVQLYKAIKNSSLKKIIICNPLLIRSIKLLNIDHMINVPLRNWFDDYIDFIIKTIIDIINNNDKFILITCCGMGAKVIISKIIQLFPNGIFLDFGSGLDLICTKRDSRGHGFTYEELSEELKELLPEDWEDEKYAEVYEQAKINMGVHLPN